MNLKIKISNIEETFELDTNQFSLISFIGMVLNRAHLASSEDLTSPLTADINGQIYQFKAKKISVVSESLPKKDKIAYLGNASLLQLNFTGFIFNLLFSGVTNFSGLNIAKNKTLNAAAQKAKNLSQLTEILLTEYQERKLEEANNKLVAKAICLDSGIGTNIPALKQLNKELTAGLKQLTLPAESMAKVKNLETREKRKAAK